MFIAQLWTIVCAFIALRIGASAVDISRQFSNCCGAGDTVSQMLTWQPSGPSADVILYVKNWLDNHTSCYCYLNNAAWHLRNDVSDTSSQDFFAIKCGSDPQTHEADCCNLTLVQVTYQESVGPEGAHAVSASVKDCKDTVGCK